MALNLPSVIDIQRDNRTEVQQIFNRLGQEALRREAANIAVIQQGAAIKQQAMALVRQGAQNIEANRIREKEIDLRHEATMGRMAGTTPAQKLREQNTRDDNERAAITAQQSGLKNEIMAEESRLRLDLAGETDLDIIRAKKASSARFIKSKRDQISELNNSLQKVGQRAQLDLPAGGGEAITDPGLLPPLEDEDEEGFRQLQATTFGFDDPQDSGTNFLGRRTRQGAGSISFPAIRRLGLDPRNLTDDQKRSLTEDFEIQVKREDGSIVNIPIDDSGPEQDRIDLTPEAIRAVNPDATFSRNSAGQIIGVRGLDVVSTKIVRKSSGAPDPNDPFQSLESIDEFESGADIVQDSQSATGIRQKAQRQRANHPETQALLERARAIKKEGKNLPTNMISKATKGEFDRGDAADWGAELDQLESEIERERVTGKITAAAATRIEEDRFRFGKLIGVPPKELKEFINEAGIPTDADSVANWVLVESFGGDINELSFVKNGVRQEVEVLEESVPYIKQVIELAENIRTKQISQPEQPVNREAVQSAIDNFPSLSSPSGQRSPERRTTPAIDPSAPTGQVDSFFGRFDTRTRNP